MSFQIKYFIKNATTKAAFETNSEFYGAGSIGRSFSVTGYPNAACTQAGNVSISPYQIGVPVDTGFTATTTGSSDVLTLTTGTNAAIAVGAYVYDGTDPQNLIFLGTVESLTGGSGGTASVLTEDALNVGANFPLFVLFTNNTNVNGYKAGESFYLAIGVQNAADAVSIFPQIKLMTTDYNPATRTGTNDPAYVDLQRTSLPGIPGTPDTAENIPCTIKRVSRFVAGNLPDTYFKTDEDKPFWVVFEVNPYGTSSTSLSKFTRFKILVTEEQPTTDVSINFTYSSAEAGWI